MAINKRAFLIILDGWGINHDPKVSAIEAADTPYFDSLCKKYANATLVTYGSQVGLPDGQMLKASYLDLWGTRLLFSVLQTHVLYDEADCSIEQFKEEKNCLVIQRKTTFHAIPGNYWFLYFELGAT